MARGVGLTEALSGGVPEWVSDLFVVLALLGDWLVVVPALGALYLTSVFLGVRTAATTETSDPLCPDRTMFVIAAVFGGLALTIALKALFDAPRPPEELHAITPSEHGFPSGHVMVATLFWGALAWWVLDGRRHSRSALVVSVVAVVGLSRLVLGVHFLVDVLASVVFAGLYLGAVGWALEDRPMPTFGLAIGLALIAVLVSGGSTRALLALLGTVVTPLGWQGIESQPVRSRLIRIAERTPGMMGNS